MDEPRANEVGVATIRTCTSQGLHFPTQVSSNDNQIIDIIKATPNAQVMVFLAPPAERDFRVTRGQCPQCGIQTHEVNQSGICCCKDKRYLPLTNEDVRRGRCLQCNNPSATKKGIVGGPLPLVDIPKGIRPDDRDYDDDISAISQGSRKTLAQWFARQPKWLIFLEVLACMATIAALGLEALKRHGNVDEIIVTLERGETGDAQVAGGVEVLVPTSTMGDISLHPSPAPYPAEESGPSLQPTKHHIPQHAPRNLMPTAPPQILRLANVTYDGPPPSLPVPVATTPVPSPKLTDKPPTSEPSDKPTRNLQGIDPLGQIERGM